MRRRSKIGLLLIAACVIAGVVLLWPRMPRRAAEVLDGADRYELLSLDPQRPELPSPEHFHGFRVLGQTTALVRCDDARRPGPGLQDAAPAFDELVLGYLDGDTATLEEAAA